MNKYTLFKLNVQYFNLGGWTLTIFRFFTQRRLFSCVKKNINLLDKRKSETCYICALGPSLKQVDLSKIQGDTIAVNRFFKIGKEYPDFRPTYYLMIDSLFKKPENRQDFLDALNQYRGKDTTYLVHSSFYGDKDLIRKDDKVFFLSCFKGQFNHKKKFSINKVMPSFGNVASTAIAVAMALGYKKIVLLGCDFNSFASTTRNHCYADKSTDRAYRMSFELFAYSFYAYLHDELQQYALEHGIEIINSTKGSLIDAYPLQIDENLYKEETILKQD